jgi:hypothetical protein
MRASSPTWTQGAGGRGTEASGQIDPVIYFGTRATLACEPHNQAMTVTAVTAAPG